MAYRGGFGDHLAGYVFLHLPGRQDGQQGGHVDSARTLVDVAYSDYPGAYTRWGCAGIGILLGTELGPPG